MSAAITTNLDLSGKGHSDTREVLICCVADCDTIMNLIGFILSSSRVLLVMLKGFQHFQVLLN